MEGGLMNFNSNCINPIQNTFGARNTITGDRISLI